MRRAVGTRGGLEDGGPTVGTVGWDEASRCDGRGGCAAVMGYLLWVIRGRGAFSFAVYCIYRIDWIDWIDWIDRIE